MAKNKVTESNKEPGAPLGADSDPAAAAEVDQVEKNPIQPANPSKSIPVLRIRTKRGVASFHRAGIAFGQEPVDLPLAWLSKDQRAALAGEPMLVIEEIELSTELPIKA